MLMMKKILIAAVSGFLMLAACKKDNIIKEPALI